MCPGQRSWSPRRSQRKEPRPGRGLHLPAPRGGLPRTTPRQKLEQIRALGGPSTEIVVEGHTYDDAHRGIGPALVGIELAVKTDLDPLLARMDRSGLHIKRLEAGSSVFRFLV